mmetsp:Transcript_2549/g.3686  ORF Transcript_2549/g.3686 Transcript_2549/m.3686 type:complete len:376 (-) Transcript_2549:36-1163(-)|eukprot:CAMPEP_0117418430 /NCGR_PEP_ID=MMETSP0758-20121206/210_1 /TAXON_ID=63605 /ORGANISM="Percolomonas cosmopolitus, Strain AE-1 (ATCC 50343)" /LENGTH=375 /DNA_ID=CAMNT_0005198923 /DNA_START=43 /DNA_END=1170 /DNA_ORIENTATION=-
MGCGASKTVDQAETPAEPIEKGSFQEDNDGKPLDSHHQQFLEAAQGGDYAQVKKFAGIVDLNVTDNKGNTAIILATGAKSNEIVNFLIEKRNKRQKATDVNHQNDNGTSALHVAAKVGCKEIIETLLKHKALADITDRNGKIPFDLAVDEETKDVFLAIAKAEKERLAAEAEAKAALEREEENEEKSLTQVDEDDYREWINCAMLGDVSAIRSFVDIKKVDVNYNDGWTALLCAAQRDHYSVCEYLLQVGADVNQVNTSDCTALHLITTHKLAKLLLDNNASIDAENEWGDTPLHDAAWHGRLDIVQLLVERGANKDAKNKNGATPLHHATKYGRDDVVKYLLEKGAESSFKDEDGMTPMDYAKSEELKKVFMMS